MISRALLLLSAVVFAGCASEPTAIPGPRASLEGLPSGLDVRFTVEPGEVQQHESFNARLEVTNTTPDTIRVVTAHGCLVVPHVLLDGRPVPLQGSGWACTAAITTHTFAPGEVRTRDWEMRASLYAQEPGDVDGAPAPRGTYRIVAEFDTYSETPPYAKPRVEAALRVR
jgi:hypothetical protein